MKDSVVSLLVLATLWMGSAACHAQNADSTGGPSLGELTDAFSYRQSLIRSEDRKSVVKVVEQQSTTPLVGLESSVASTPPEIVLPAAPVESIAAVLNKEVVIADDSFDENPANCADVDRDGVCDNRDHCPDTPQGSVVMPHGCHLTLQAPLELVGVFFDFNGYRLRPESKEILERVAALLKQRDNFVVEVAGHTDTKGDSEVNRVLSRRRAKSVYDYLVDRGVSPYRLSYHGYGANLPVSANHTRGGDDSPGGRARNRRVELRVTGSLAALE